MKKIGVLSDTHGSLPHQVFDFFAPCDEIWHAGDIGRNVLQPLQDFKPLRAVWGNMDDNDMHFLIPKTQLFSCEGHKIIITHIGGYPGHYPAPVAQLLKDEKPDIFVAGHSHITKVMYDPQFQLLHINPGAAGYTGFHKVCTIVRFDLGEKPTNMEIMEYPRWPKENN